MEGAGHYGIFSGRRWRDIVYPQVRAFIAANAATTAQAPSGNVTPLKRRGSRKAG